MIAARYYDEARTMVEVSDGNSVKLFPTSLRSPEWVVLLGLVDEGRVAIQPFAPPASSAPDAQPSE